MNAVATSSPPPIATEKPIGGTRRGSVIVQNKFAIPGWVCDLPTYRRWACSSDYPQSGGVAFLDGDLFVDPDMETFLFHNQVKQAFNVAIGMFLMNNPLGRYVPDRMLLTNVAANLSTEPDGLYAHWETFRSGRLSLVAGKEIDYTELEGIPDMVLEIVSASSEKKDAVTLRELYAKAKIPEYWLVDARAEEIAFEVFRYSGGGYQSTAYEDGWVRSEVFGRCVQLIRGIDPLAHPQFVVQMKP